MIVLFSEQRRSLLPLRKYVRTRKYAGLGHVCYVRGALCHVSEVRWNDTLKTPDMIGGICILMSKRPIPTFVFGFSMVDIWCEERQHVFPLHLYLYL